MKSHLHDGAVPEYTKWVHRTLQDKIEPIFFKIWPSLDFNRSFLHHYFIIKLQKHVLSK